MTIFHRFDWLKSFQNSWIRKTSFVWALHQEILISSHKEIAKWNAFRIYIHKQHIRFILEFKAILWVLWFWTKHQSESIVESIKIHARKTFWGKTVVKSHIFTYSLAFLDVKKLHSKTRKGGIGKKSLGSNRAYMS